MLGKFIKKRDSSFGIDLHDTGVGILHQIPVFCFALLQDQFSFFPVSFIDNSKGNPCCQVSGVQRGCTELNIDDTPVFSLPPALERSGAGLFDLMDPFLAGVFKLFLRWKKELRGLSHKFFRCVPG